jgi:hypothetical protein
MNKSDGESVRKVELSANETSHIDRLGTHASRSTKRVTKHRNTLKYKITVNTELRLFSEPILVIWTLDFPSYRSRAILKGVEKFCGYTEHKITSQSKGTKILFTQSQYQTLMTNLTFKSHQAAYQRPYLYNF